MTPSAEEVARMPWQERVLAALRDGVAEVIAEHKRLALPLVVWRDGKVVHITAEEAEAEFRAANSSPAANS
jgi:hypothetical protein